MIGRFAKRMPVSLADLATQYLAQDLPDISGIFSLPQASSVTTPVVQQPVTAPGLTPEQLRLLYGQRSDDRDDGFRGGGKFGNLDLTRSKTVVRDVYDEESGEFVPTELTAYYNPTLGNFQTFEGKNINPAFSNTGITPSFLFNMFGLKPNTVGGFVPGSIRGAYDSPMDLIKRNRNEDPGMTPAQITRRKKGLESMSEVYQDIGRNRDRDDGPSGGGGGPSYSGMGSIGSGGGRDRDPAPSAPSNTGRAASSWMDL